MGAGMRNQDHPFPYPSPTGTGGLSSQGLDVAPEPRGRPRQAARCDLLVLAGTRESRAWRGGRAALRAGGGHCQPPCPGSHGWATVWGHWFTPQTAGEVLAVMSGAGLSPAPGTVPCWFPVFLMCWELWLLPLGMAVSPPPAPSLGGSPWQEGSLWQERPPRVGSLWQRGPQRAGGVTMAEGSPQRGIPWWERPPRREGTPWKEGSSWSQGIVTPSGGVTGVRGLLGLFLAMSPPLPAVFLPPAPNLCGMIKPEAFLLSAGSARGRDGFAPSPNSGGVPRQCPLRASLRAGPGRG